MFLAEARLAAILDHPNVVQVFDIGTDGRDYFFTMEYVYGENLHTLLQVVRRRGEACRSSRRSTIAIGRGQRPRTTRTSASGSTACRCGSCTATCRRPT